MQKLVISTAEANSIFLDARYFSEVVLHHVIFCLQKYKFGKTTVVLMENSETGSYCHRQHRNGPESRQNTGVLGVNSDFIYSA